MSDVKFIALISIVLVLGTLIPILTYYLSGRGVPTTTTITPSNLGGFFTKPLKAGMKTFKSYDELASFLTSNETISYLGGIYGSMAGASTPIFSGAYPMPTVTMTNVYNGPMRRAYAGGGGEYSSTNVQVSGVDEPDTVKTNGKIIAYSQGSRVYIIDPVGTSVVRVLNFTNRVVRGMFMAGNKLVVITQSNPYRTAWLEERILLEYPGLTETTIFVYDTSIPTIPVLKYNLTVNGWLRGARLIGDAGYFVFNIPVYASSGEIIVPAVNCVPVPPQTITVVNTADAIDQYTMILGLNITTGAYRTQSFLIGIGSWMYMSYTHLVLTSSGLGGIYYAIYKSTVTLLTEYLTPMENAELAEKIRAGDYIGSYQLLQQYLAEKLASMQPDQRDEFVKNLRDKLETISVSENTTLHVFGLNGLNLTYMGNLTVPGRILDQFSIDEYKGRYLVVATTRDTYTPYIGYDVYTRVGYGSGVGTVSVYRYSDGETVTRTYTVNPQPPGELKPRIYVYIWARRQSRDNLVTIYDLEGMRQASQLTGIAQGEGIYSSRLIGDLFILVTYRQVDPLFTIDISDPYNPRVIGYLEMPGYNGYIHPLGDGLIIGVGMDGASLKIALYNISDPSNIREVSVITIPSAKSIVITDYHAFTIDKMYKRFYIPIATWKNRLIEGILEATYANNTLDTLGITGLYGASRTAYVDGKLFLFGYNTVIVLDRLSLQEIGQITLQS